MLVMAASSFRLQTPLNESPSHPCSHEIILQSSKSTHWQRWLKVWVEHAHLRTFGLCIDPCGLWSLQYEQLQAISSLGKFIKFSNSFVEQRHSPFSLVRFQVFMAYFRSFVSQFIQLSLTGTHNIRSAALMTTHC